VLGLRDWTGCFMVDTFSLPLDRGKVTSVRPTEGFPHPGLDFHDRRRGAHRARDLPRALASR
jgi:hypothetical protein